MSERSKQEARVFDTYPLLREMALKFAEQIKKKVPISTKSKLLDCGCGSGLVGMHLYEDVASLVMMDTSEAMLDILREKIARNNIRNMRVIHADLHGASLHAEEFDVIYMNNVLHHIEDITGFLTDLCRVLKQDGCLCLGDLCVEDGSFHGDIEGVYHCGFDENHLGQLLKNRGLVHIRWEEYYVFTKSDATGTVRDYPVFFMSAIKPSSGSALSGSS